MGKKEQQGRSPQGKKLTQKMRLYVAERIKDPARPAYKAAEAAGYKGSNQVLRVMAAKLEKNPLVRAALADALAEQERRIQEKIDVELLKGDRIILELLSLSLVDIGEAFDDEGRLKPLKDIPEGVRRAFVGIEVFEEFEGRGKDRTQIGFTKKVKLADKVRALELLTRHADLRKKFPQKVEVTGPEGAPLVPMNDTEIANRLLSLLQKLEKRAQESASRGDA